MIATPPRELAELALASWRRSRAPDTAAAFEASARRALVDWTPPVTGSARAFHRAWLRSVRDVISRGWAITTLLDQLPGDDPVQRASALAKRLEVLAQHGPDPRFRHVLAMIGSSEYAGRVAVALKRIAAFGQDEPPVAPVIRELPPATPEIEALWRDVHADPDDDGPLTVLADALQLAGDPRGELIALQLGPPGDDEPARFARRSALIASCGAAWLGRLTQVTGAASFERGALRRLQLSSERPVSDPSWEALIAEPALATVTDLLPGNVASDVYARFVTSSALRSLTRIEVGSTLGRYRAVFPVPPTISHLACPDVPINELTPVLAAATALRSIAIQQAQLDPLMLAPWFPQLTAVTLGVGGGLRRGLGRWRDLPPRMALTLVPGANLPPCSAAFPWDFGVTLVRDGGATVARVSGDWLLFPLAALTALPPDTARVEVDHPSEALAERIRSAIARASVEVVRCPSLRTAAVFVPTRDDCEASR